MSDAQCSPSPQMSPEAMLCDPDEWVWLQAMARDNNYLAPTPMGGGQWAALSRFAFTCAILTGHMFDDFTYENRWCYDSTHKAAIGLADWISNGFEGEPKGWHRHPDSGRRRPDGDQAKEYVNQ